LDNDGLCEFLIGNENQNAVFKWAPSEKSWKNLNYALPEGTAVVDVQGQDRGLRFADINDDGYADVVFSNEQAYSVDLFMPELFLDSNQAGHAESSPAREGMGQSSP
jgi:hypothetical protein